MSIRNYSDIHKDIALTGFFSEYLPPCFCLSSTVLCVPPPTNCDMIPPYSFTMSRFNQNNARRTIFIPEIGSYIAAYSYAKENYIFQELIDFAETDTHSFSPLLGHNDTLVRHEQIYNGCSVGSESVGSDYIHNIGRKIIYAAGAKKVLKLDISNCFSSFYMHMMPAILLGAKTAQSEFQKYVKDSSDASINPVYLKYRKFDEVIRRQNLNRTNGLLTGTLMSKIIAEAMLTRVDKELESFDLRFVRYVDDYEVFLDNEDDEKRVISVFTDVLKRYGFTLNTEKTVTLSFPFYIVENFEKIVSGKLTDTLDDTQIIDIFNTFFEFEKRGTKGSIRYLLKTLEKRHPLVGDADLYKAYLITVMANDERSLTKSCSILISEKSKYRLTASDVDILTTLLRDHLAYGNDLEVTWILYLLHKTENLHVGDAIISEISNSYNELAQAMLVRYGLFDAAALSQIKERATSWLLLYELYVDETITEEIIISKLHLNKNLYMYQKLKHKGVHFLQ